MNAIQELIEAANMLCKSLDSVSKNDRLFSDKVLCEFERMSWETLRIAEDLKQIKDYVRG